MPSTSATNGRSIWTKGFQDHVLAASVREPNMINLYRDALEPGIFENPKKAKIFQWVLEYHDRYRLPPNKTALIEILNSKLPRREKSDDYLPIIDSVFSIPLDESDTEFVRDKIVHAAKVSSIKRALLKSVNFLYEEKFDEIKKAIDTAFSIGEGVATRGVSFKNEWESILRIPSEERRTVNVGYKNLQKIIGGVEIGELLTIMAPPNIGKTLVLQNLGAGAWVHGHRVGHYSFELSERKTVLRYASRVSKVRYREMLDQIKEVKKRIEAVNVFSNGDIEIKFLPPKSVSVAGLRSHILFLKSNDFPVDLVIFDYADLIKPAVIRKERREELSEIYTDLRAVASELELAALTATQSRRASLYKQVLDLNEVAEDWGKVAIADIVAAICQTREEFDKKIFRIHVAKTRGETRGKQAYFKVDYDKLSMMEVNRRAYLRMLPQGTTDRYEKDEFEEEEKADEDFVGRKRKKDRKKSPATGSFV